MIIKKFLLVTSMLKGFTMKAGKHEKLNKKFSISFCKISKNKLYYAKVVLKIFHPLNAHTVGFDAHT